VVSRTVVRMWESELWERLYAVTGGHVKILLALPNYNTVTVLMFENTQTRPGYRALRAGRSSVEGGRYFITVVTRNRERDLTQCYGDMLASALQMESWCLNGMVVMPDHGHLAIDLLQDELSSVIRQWKGQVSVSLRRVGLLWQKGFHDRRLRVIDHWSPYFRYMLSNPYKAGLVGWQDHWPFFWCSRQWWSFFGAETNGFKPYPEWQIGYPWMEMKPAPTGTQNCGNGFTP
jgi:putative transposase